MDEQEQKEIGAGAVRPTGAGATDPTASAASALVTALNADPNYGNCCASATATPTCTAINAFKVAYNTALNGGDTSGTSGDGSSSTSGYLPHNGLYDQACADAVNATLGSGAPPVIAGTPCGGGQPVQPNNNNQQVTTTSSGWPWYVKAILWAIALGGAVGLGLWLWKTFGSSRPMAAEPKRKRGKRTSKKR